VNDGKDQAKPLVALARRLNAKINLIPYNIVDGLEWERPSESVQDAFLEALLEQNVKATLRHEKDTTLSSLRTTAAKD